MNTCYVGLVWPNVKKVQKKHIKQLLLTEMKMVLRSKEKLKVPTRYKDYIKEVQKKHIKQLLLTEMNMTLRSQEKLKEPTKFKDYAKE